VILAKVRWRGDKESVADDAKISDSCEHRENSQKLGAEARFCD
jgi:hypothetical protein